MEFYFLYQSKKNNAKVRLMMKTGQHISFLEKSVISYFPEKSFAKMGKKDSKSYGHRYGL